MAETTAELLARAESLAFKLKRVVPDDCGNERACGQAADVIRLLLSHVDSAIPERDTALEACRAMIAWDDAEKQGPDYGTQTRDTHPDGELIWRRWWEDQQRLCERAFDTARAAIARATGEKGPSR